MCPNPIEREPVEQPRLIVLSAPSGAGKTTLCHLLLKEFNQIQLSISATTRPQRPNEKDGIDYFFYSKPQFKEMEKKGAFVEWAQVHDNHYGTPRTFVENTLAENKHVLFDIDVQGAMSLRDQYPRRVLLIFVHPPSMEILEERLRKRGSDSASTIERRIQNAYNELEWSKEFDHQITNDNLDAAYLKLKEIVQKECR